jgi:hypothetical protein
MMKRLLGYLLAIFPAMAMTGDYESSLLVQTGKLRESDLIVRTVTDLEDSRICLAFYVRTVGTSPAMSCYDAVPGFRSKIRQIGHFKDDKLVVRKFHDSVNLVSCLVAYVSTDRTSPVINCYKVQTTKNDSLIRKAHLREGDLHVHQIIDPGSNETCLVAHVSTGGTSPALKCYSARNGKGGGLDQTGYLKEGDLVVRKVRDLANGIQCLVTYVSTEGTSPYIHCPTQPASALAEAPGNAPPTKAIDPRVQPSFRIPRQ